MQHTEPTLMISPCGTSLLTNLAGNEERSLIRKHSNASENEIEKKDIVRLKNIVKQAQKQLSKANFQEVCRHSAELNAISRYYEMGQTVNKKDIHILLASDTWLGRQTARLAGEWLNKHVNDVRIEVRKDLTTNNLMQFQSAMSDLVKDLDEQIESYREKNYHVVFNLTGGFKSVQGFLQTLAMFYADEAIYIFQSQDELLRLPRLPVKMDAEETVRKHLKAFRRLSMNMTVDTARLQEIPEIFYIQIGDEISLSPWGELIWKQVKKEIYREKIFESPDVRIQYSDSFTKSVRLLASDRNYNLNRRLDDLMHYLETGQNLNSLDLKSLSGNPVPGSTHEFDAWADRDGKRVFCHYDGDILILDKMDNALH